MEVKIVLGIDPGFTTTGFAVIKKELQKTLLLDCGFLALPPSQTLAMRINHFYDFFTQKITAFGITDIALETPFLGKNAQNFLKLGYLRGIVYLLINQHGLALHEFSPREVKYSITGFGGADKDQVARVVLRLFPTLAVPKKADVTDALAITLCGLWQQKKNVISASAMKR
jgi:crossover junction endodeoxyribonuclease RuvC